MSGEELLDTLRQCRVLDAAQLDELTTEVRDRHLEPAVLLQELTRLKRITPYQSEMLLQGRGRELLLGSYVLLDRLGQGGMGAIYEARQWKGGSRPMMPAQGNRSLPADQVQETRCDLMHAHVAISCAALYK